MNQVETEFQEYDPKKDPLLPLAEKIIEYSSASRNMCYRRATKQEDYQEATDEIGKPLPRISVRSSTGWGNNFSLRVGKEGDGNKYEFQKIMEGQGDHYFYGFHEPKRLFYKEWVIFNLHVFRQIIKSEGVEPFGWYSSKNSNNMTTLPYRVFFIKPFRHYKSLDAYPGFIVDTNKLFKERTDRDLKICYEGLMQQLPLAA